MIAHWCTGKSEHETAVRLLAARDEIVVSGRKGGEHNAGRGTAER